VFGCGTREKRRWLACKAAKSLIRKKNAHTSENTQTYKGFLSLPSQAQLQIGESGFIS